ncbi:solute carrier organic anion transporter [Rhodobacteraceae bacterium N5(2021)]|uniref:Solute carrier organic anion transporter n=1 Tax=Gymnodinialimonas phycosphaerae TaxID=2841589 RepID=A0A975TYN8_9RHOB|nr:solute carrier organic anion transporter [Gymnodinialimonas phycosphaerae]MBY4893199.1 solute carrier organic anion transporter [Gymnodinialimonas phycosphaerae]
MTEGRPPFAPRRAVLKLMEIAGQFCIGLILSSAMSGAVLWATRGLPDVGDYDIYWQGQVGTAMGYGLVSTCLAVPIWLIGSVWRRLRWMRAWWLGLVLANGLTLTAYLAAIPTGSGG